MSTIKLSRAVETYKARGGFGEDRTVEAVLSGVPRELFAQLTGQQLGIVMSAVNQAYQRGRASAGAEMVDNDAVWVNAWGALVELPPTGKPDGTRLTVVAKE